MHVACRQHVCLSDGNNTAGSGEKASGPARKSTDGQREEEEALKLVQAKLKHAQDPQQVLARSHGSHVLLDAGARRKKPSPHSSDVYWTQEDQKPEAGESEPEGDTEPEASDTEPEAGDTEPEAGDTQSETGDTQSEAGSQSGESDEDEGRSGDDQGDEGNGEVQDNMDVDRGDDDEDQGGGDDGGAAAYDHMDVDEEVLDTRTHPQPTPVKTQTQSTNASSHDSGSLDARIKVMQSPHTALEGGNGSSSKDVVFPIVDETPELPQVTYSEQDVPEPFQHITRAMKLVVRALADPKDIKAVRTALLNQSLWAKAGLAKEAVLDDFSKKQVASAAAYGLVNTVRPTVLSGRVALIFRNSSSNLRAGMASSLLQPALQRP